jgi:membrane protein DedA with SNARE-associated domain
LGSPETGKLKKKAPQIIAVAIAVALISYIIFQIIEDTVIEGVPLTSEPLIGAIIGFLENVTATVSSWGYGGIFGLMVLEASSLPIPSEIVLPFAGFLISQPMSSLNFYVTIIVATTAAMIGSLIDYYIGWKGVEALMKYRLLGRAILNEDQIKIAARWFTKYGSVMVFVARLIPGFRTIISFPAGAVKMPLAKFLAYTLAGCLVWNTLLIYVGFYLGTNWTEVASVSHYLIIATIAVLVAAAAVYLVIRHQKRKMADSSAKISLKLLF